jgi:hypothetical protein
MAKGIDKGSAKPGGRIYSGGLIVGGKRSTPTASANTYKEKDGQSAEPRTTGLPIDSQNPPEFIRLQNEYSERLSELPMWVLDKPRAERVVILRDALRLGQKLKGDTTDVKFENPPGKIR